MKQIFQLTANQVIKPDVQRVEWTDKMGLWDRIYENGNLLPFSDLLYDRSLCVLLTHLLAHKLPNHFGTLYNCSSLLAKPDKKGHSIFFLSHSLGFLRWH